MSKKIRIQERPRILVKDATPEELVKEEFEKQLERGSADAYEVPRVLRRSQFLDIWGISRGE